MEGKKEDREKNLDVQRKHPSVASLTLPTWDLACNPGMCPEWNQTSNLLVSGTMPKPLSHTRQSCMLFLKNTVITLMKHGKPT